MESPNDPLGPPADLLELYSGYLDRSEEEGGLRFEEFLAAHPDHRGELEALHREWNRVEGLLDRLGVPGAAEDPGLDPPREDPPTEETLERLGSRRDGFGRYELGEVIARGGMGTVRRVWDQDLRRHLAMKVVEAEPPEPGGSSPSRSRRLARFLEEAQVAAQLDHPGITPVHEIGLDDRGQVYFTMKLVKGSTLREVFEEVGRGDGRWTLPGAVGLVLRVCEAMAYAHEKGVLHRDLKPSNVMVGRFGEVFVMDWGLARVRGREDGRDVRIAEEEELVSSVRGERLPEDVDSPLFTMEGDVIGTPAYMSPEQASSKTGEVGETSDVYAVGAMLYHLITGRVPFTRPGERSSGREILERVRAGDLPDVNRLAPGVPRELRSICSKAMSRRPADRYADMLMLGQDLRAYLEGRVVSAFRTGPLEELSKWFLRNRWLAGSALLAGVLALSGGLSTGVVAAKKAAVESMVERLAAAKELDLLEQEAGRLWPVRPDRRVSYEDWMRRASELAHRIDGDGNTTGFRRELFELRKRALPVSEAELELERRQHELHYEMVDLEQRLVSLRAAQAVRRGDTQVAPDDLGDRELPRSSRDLSALAWPLVHPVRTTFGRETEGWALALRAVEAAVDEAERAEAAFVEAWALLAVGLDAQALEASERANAWLEEPRSKYTGQRQRLSRVVRRGVEGKQLEIDEKSERLEGYRAAVLKRRTWHFKSPREQAQHDQLADLVARLENLVDPAVGLMTGLTAEHGFGVGDRLALAEEMERRLRSDAALWDAVRAEMAAGGQYGDLQLAVQPDLVPLGADPVSGLQEFAHLASGDVPERVDGRLVREGGTGIVFVLLPGGTYLRGAQAGDPRAPNFDPDATGNAGPPHHVVLEPFFLSKYELTQYQWYRINGAFPSRFGRGYRSGERSIYLGHPVEEVSWESCDVVLSRYGLSFPTEAQWEYAARAGSQGLWGAHVRAEELAASANLFDQCGYTHTSSRDRPYEPWSDRYDLHAPAGSYAANAFGLHDMFGNVREWCLDAYQEGYRRWGLRAYEPKVDPSLARERAAKFRMVRGGGFESTAFEARVARREVQGPDLRARDLGVRPARPLER